MCVFVGRRARGDFPIVRAAIETIGIKGNANGLGKKKSVCVCSTLS